MENFEMANKLIISSFLFLVIINCGSTVPIPNGDNEIERPNEIDFEGSDDFVEIVADDTNGPPYDKNDIIDLSHLNQSIFGEPDKKTGAAIARYDPKIQFMNPEELGSYFEGDILMPKGFGRNGMLSQSLRWHGGVIPYEIRGDFSAKEREIIKRGINEYHAKTCLRFVPRTNERDYISIVNDDTGCWSSVGRVGGKQELNLQTPGCTTKSGTFMHEMMHALGFLHEQNRHERDNFITIQWNNIQSGVSHNFDKASSQSTYAFGVPYDYGSIMHYSAYAFSRNGEPTIIAKQAATMGQREAFTSKDLEKIRNMYQCSFTTNQKPNANKKPNKRPSKRPQHRPNQHNPVLAFFGNLFGKNAAGEQEGDKNLIESNQTLIETNKI